MHVSTWPDLNSRHAQTNLKFQGALFSSVGGAGIPCTEALSAAAPGSSPGLGPIAACHSPLSHPVPCHLLNCPVNKAI